MEIITGVFETHKAAARATEGLLRSGISEKQIGLLTPNTSDEDVESVLPVSDTERPGIGKAMGAAVGAGIGAAGGATLGLAAATLMVPGVGPVLAFGLLGGVLLGGTGAALGAAIGDSIEEELGEGIPHENIYLYEDALRHGRSVVVAYAEEGKQADDARKIVNVTGALEFDRLRDDWWAELRDAERSHYVSGGRDFERDELSYRRGFEAAQHFERRGRPYHEAEENLKQSYPEEHLNDAFRRGYERGLNHHARRLEIRGD